MDFEAHLGITKIIDAHEKKIRALNPKPTLKQLFVYLKKQEKSIQPLIKKKFGPCVSKTIFFISIARRFGFDVEAVEVKEDEDGVKYPIFQQSLVSHVCAAVKTKKGTQLVDLTRQTFPAKHREFERMSDEYLLSTAHSNRGPYLSFEKAEEELKHAIDIYPKNYEAHLNLADLYIRNKNTSKALEIINYLKLKIPKDSMLLLHLSRIYYDLGLFDDAEVAVDDSLNSFPKNEYAKTLKAALLIAKDRPHDALKHLETVADTPHSLFHKTIAHLMVGNAQKARSTVVNLFEVADNPMLKTLGKIILNKFPQYLEMARDCFDVALSKNLSDEEAFKLYDEVNKLLKNR